MVSDRGLEEVVAAEVSAPEIGGFDVRPGKAGVSFRGDSLEVGYRANLWLRAAIRLLVHVAEGPLDGRLSGGDELYRFFRTMVDWPSLLRPGQTFSVQARVRDCTDIPSTMLVQIRARDAICDSIRDSGRERPQPPNASAPADLPLYAALWRDHITIYRDMSGDSLHRRGYRSAMHKASLNEAAAAGCLALAGWPHAATAGKVLADPMCGSGTFLIEAALMATHTAPGLYRRRWPFEGWPDFDAAAWRRCVEDAKGACRPWKGTLHGNDIHSGALALAAKDVESAGMSKLVKLTQGPCLQWRPAQRPTMVVTNPPWGTRLLGQTQQPGSFPRQAEEADGASSETDLEAAWTDLGLFLKGQCPEADVAVLSGNKRVTAKLMMKADKRFPMTIGGVDCRLIKYKVLPPKPGGFSHAGSALPIADVRRGKRQDLS
ncbi:Ribosomal RNA large subunit methyltransferase K/L [Coccomyxa sp. Obi]|nr:Ribosomal RNA large subunit methyltransferase K/L [Coccomyxa sp. Obi]